MSKQIILAGPATEQQCPRIVLRGNSYQRGRQYGRAFKDYLPGFYDFFVNQPATEVLTAEYRFVLDKLEATMEHIYPQFFDEIKGRADGSGMSYEACRILAFHNDIKSMLQPGCSNVLTTRGANGPWLARTCDLFERERSWQVFTVNLADDCLSYAGTGYLGLMSCLGVNSAGLAIGGSSSSTDIPPSTRGLANAAQVMLARLDTTSACCRLAEQTGFTGKGANLAILDASGDAAVIEYAPGIAAIRRPDETGFLACTNYSVSGIIPPSKAVLAGMENSTTRYRHLQKMIGQATPESRSVDLAEQALADHTEEHHVCQHIPDGYHTIYSWIIQPGTDRSVMRFCWGYPCRGEYQKIELDWQ